MDDKEDKTVKDSETAHAGTSVNETKRKKDVEDNICSFIFLPTTPSSFSDILHFTYEKLCREPNELWEPPIKRGNSLFMQSRAGLLMMYVFHMIGNVSYQPRRGSTPQVSRNFEKEEFSASCECHNGFKILEDILRSGKFQFLIFRNCHGKADLSIGTTTKPISSDESRRLHDLLTDAISYKDAIDDLNDKTFKIDEFSNKPGLNGVKTDHDLLKELNELKYRYRVCFGKIMELKEEICGKIIQNGFDKHSDQALEGEGSTSRDVLSTADTKQSMNSDSLVDHNYSLPTLLCCISERLNEADWLKLRRLFTYHVPGTVLKNIQNGVELFQEFVARDFISHENLDFLRGVFYEINRIDLVHIIDCVKEGDYGLLDEERLPELRRNRNPTVENTSRNDNRRLRQQIQNLTFSENPNVSNARISRGPTGTSSSITTTDDVMLPRTSSDVPQGPQVSYPVQVSENRAVVNNSNIDGNNSNFDGNSGGNNTAKTATSHEHTTSDSDSRDETAVEQSSGSAGEESSGSETSTEVKSPVFSCLHYERHCDMQFSCCEKFWPCHRCHNSESSCATKRLRSRDIKNVKCKQCAKVQEFPKETPHCVECNVKFAEYFCAVCQHLTGTQNHPYHCEKCGICRVHGDRSFHCDVCGVCLDVNLKDNHKCRAGSAHDQCCICFEDAFTGCQILPCSHKVHKECASLMLRNGITKCPICRESFEHRIERRPKSSKP